VRFTVLRLDGDSYSRVASTDLVALDGTTDYPTSIPVKKGDLIGVVIPGGADVRENVNPITATWVGLHEDEPGRIAYLEPSPADGATSQVTGMLDGTLALAGGVLTNRSGAEHGFVITVRFLDGPVELGSGSDELEHELGDGDRWAWEAVLTVDPDQVNTDGLDCRVEQVEIGDVVSD
jgi:hypothetical protein